MPVINLFVQLSRSKFRIFPSVINHTLTSFSIMIYLTYIILLKIFKMVIWFDFPETG